MKIKRCRSLLLLLGVLLLAGCRDEKAGKAVTGTYYNPAADTKTNVEEGAGADAAGQDAEAEDGTQAEDERITADLFLITSNDMQEQCLIMKQLASGKQYMYNYSAVTSFVDKYGNHASVYSFEPGRVVTIGEKDERGRVLKVQISDRVWEYPDVTRYSIDAERGVFTIAGTNYSFDKGLYVNSDGKPENVADLTDMDILRVAGIGKKVLAVSVTTGHGELELTNTELFEGSFIQVGSEIFAEITPNMTLELPEGTYTVAVANKGYGGSTDVQIERGSTALLDLDTLKGEGPKTGEILFAIDVVDAVLQIDGKVVDYSKAIPLKYGVHLITVTADAYDTYSKRLYVNSKEATIVISLTGEGIPNTTKDDTNDNTDDNTDGDKAAGQENGDAGNSNNAGNAGNNENRAGSLAGSHTGGGTGSNGNNGNASLSGGNLDDATLNSIINDMLNGNKNNGTGNNSGSSNADYLTTLTELISALKGKDAN